MLPQAATSAMNRSPGSSGGIGPKLAEPLASMVIFASDGIRQGTDHGAIHMEDVDGRRWDIGQRVPQPQIRVRRRPQDVHLAVTHVGADENVAGRSVAHDHPDPGRPRLGASRHHQGDDDGEQSSQGD